MKQRKTYSDFNKGLGSTAICRPSFQVLLLLSAVGFMIASSPTSAAQDSISVLPSGMTPPDKGNQRVQQHIQGLELRMIAGSRPATISFELINTGDATVSILRDGTPFDDSLSTDVLRIVPAGKVGINQPRARYIGPVYRRIAPDSTRFLEVAPGESLSAEIGIVNDYEIDFDGAFRVSHFGSIEVVTSTSLRSRATITDQVETWQPSVEPIELDLSMTSATNQFRARTPAYDQCSVTQQGMIETATLAGEAITNESLQSLRQTPAESRLTSPRYTTWFGPYTAPNYGFVTEVFSRVFSILADESIRYSCEPTQCSSSSVIAYVQPFLREDVNLCPLFFDSRLNDADRTGTVVHELTHLLRTGSTDDFSYGPAATAALAQINAVEALNNAESFTLFATNNEPFLPMIDDGSSPIIEEVPFEPSPGITFELLEGGSTARSTITENTFHAFRVSQATALELTSLSGDVDLYVYDNTSLAEVSLVCSSVEFSSDSTLDSCQITNQSDLFAIVYGYTAASYELVAVPRASDGGATIAEGAVELSIGENVTGSLGEREGILYTAIMPGRVVLTSLTGDADLYVFSNATLSTEDLVCTSFLETPEDMCLLPGSGRVHIGVLGYSAVNQFELAIEVPPSDEPNIPASSNSGGGTVGSVGLLLLTGFAFTARRRRPVTVLGLTQ